MVGWMGRWMKRLKSGWKADGNMEERKKPRKDEWMNGREKGNRKR